MARHTEGSWIHHFTCSAMVLAVLTHSASAYWGGSGIGYTTTIILSIVIPILIAVTILLILFYLRQRTLSSRRKAPIVAQPQAPPPPVPATQPDPNPPRYSETWEAPYPTQPVFPGPPELNQLSLLYHQTQSTNDRWKLGCSRPSRFLKSHLPRCLVPKTNDHRYRHSSFKCRVIHTVGLKAF
ncbi:hypothetical protein AHF37_00457 [Paragonimus kellicotti]|nr:hypothetical protein AHF37_00457 [Paragonimus kellicotti]